MSPDGVSRVVQGIVTGIGFLGAGAILKLDREAKSRPTYGGRHMDDRRHRRCCRIGEPRDRVA